MTTMAEYMVNQLMAWDVRRVYGVVGDTLLPLTDAISRQNRLHFVPVRHEAAAGFMAAAEAKLTGRPGVCLATSGPGIANLLNGLGDAHADGTPVVAITGQVETRKLGTTAKQYVDQQSLVRPLARSSSLIAHPAAAGDVLPAALRTAWTQRGVAHVSVPADLMAAPCFARVAPPEPWLDSIPTPDPAGLQEAAGLMAAARRPIILAGQGTRPARDAVLALAERWGAGILQSLPAKGALPGTHELVLSGLGDGGSDAAHTALREADLVLAVGCNWWPDEYVPANPLVVKIDRVPGHIGGNMPVRLGLVGDVRTVVPALLEALPEDARAEWRQQVAAWRAALQRQVDEEATPSEPRLRPQFIVRALEQALPPDAIITLDTGDHTVWFNRIFQGDRHEILVSGNWRSLGFGLPAALAAKLTRRDRTVAALVGDAGLQSVLGELATAAGLGLPVLVVVVNNGMMAIERHRAEAQGLSTLGTQPFTPDFAAVAAACGMKSHTARTASELNAALRAALDSDAPALVDVTASAPVAPTARG